MKDAKRKITHLILRLQFNRPESAPRKHKPVGNCFLPATPPRTLVLPAHPYCHCYWSSVIAEAAQGAVICSARHEHTPTQKDLPPLQIQSKNSFFFPKNRCAPLTSHL